MCLILFALDAHPEYRLVLAANRDEFHDRPTAPLARWTDETGIIAGRDLRGGGTWLGVTPGGRWAAVTNVHGGSDRRPDARSRGHLVTDFLTAADTPAQFATSLLERLDSFNGFNLLAGTDAGTVWVTNRGDEGPAHSEVTPGIHGISNHLLDTKWPKVVRGRRELQRVVQSGGALAADDLLSLLLDRAYAADRDLPSTGAPAELERALSATFIMTPEYGTRSSSALLIGRGGRILFAERRFDAAGEWVGEERIELGGTDSASSAPPR